MFGRATIRLGIGPHSSLSVISNHPISWAESHWRSSPNSQGTGPAVPNDQVQNLSTLYGHGLRCSACSPGLTTTGRGNGQRRTKFDSLLNPRSSTERQKFVVID